MNGLNSVTIGGNVTRDPEIRQTNGGMCVLSFSVAVNSGRKNQQTGEWEDYPNFIDCTMFGKRAEGVGRYLAKGCYVALTGSLRQERWEAKDGGSRSKLSVVVGEIHFERRDSPVQATAPDVYDEDIPF